MVWARSQNQGTRHASTKGGGHDERHADGHCRRPRRGSSRAGGTDTPRKPAWRFSGWRCGGDRPARGRSPANAGPHGRNAAAPCSAAPRGARSPATSGCPCSSSGCPPHAAGPPMTTASMGTPPAGNSSSTVPCGWCARGATGVAHATVIPGKATKQSWSASKSHAHGSVDDPRRGRQP